MAWTSKERVALKTDRSVFNAMAHFCFEVQARRQKGNAEIASRDYQAKRKKQSANNKMDD